MTDVMTDVKIIDQIQKETRKRGRPHKEPIGEITPPENKIKKADVITDSTRVDPWFVRNKNPELEYRWGRMDNDMEMMEFAAKGYIPAAGDEIIIGNPFEATKCGAGERKIRGQRILMCCPKNIINARKEVEARKGETKSQSANQESRKLAAKTDLGALEIEETKAIRRESIQEPMR